MGGKEGNKHVSLRKITKTAKLDRELDKCISTGGKKPIKNFSQSLQKWKKPSVTREKKKSIIARNKVNKKGTGPKRLKERNTLASLIGDSLSQKCLSFHN